MKGVVIAGTSSGVGKTLISVGLMAAFKRRGLQVQPFKVGPDFLDPMHHEAATGRDSVNLDGWMLSQEVNMQCYLRNSSCTDIAIVEGVMGLFDGRDGKSDDGSTAEMAKILGLPVLLVLDSWALSRSAAAIVHGFSTFDPNLKLAGVIFNKVAGATHLSWLKEAIETTSPDIKILGGIPKCDDIGIPERHLGLLNPKEEGIPEDYIDRLADLIEANLDLDGILELAQETSEDRVLAVQPEGRLLEELQENGVQGYEEEEFENGIPHGVMGMGVRIGVAKDEAFCFYYHENLALLRDAGAELVFFSPISDPLPSRLDAVYLGGGYPELYAEKLAENTKMLYAIKAFASAGGVVYAECGGLMYLSQSLETLEGKKYEMCGVFPFRTRMVSQMKMGYVQIAGLEENTLVPPEIGKVRGQIFHYSEIVCDEEEAKSTEWANTFPAYKVVWQAGPPPRGEREREAGYIKNGVLASYIHLHFGSNPHIAEALVERCRSSEVKAASVAAASAMAVADSGPSAAAAAGAAAALAVSQAILSSHPLSLSHPHSLSHSYAHSLGQLAGAEDQNPPNEPSASSSASASASAPGPGPGPGLGQEGGQEGSGSGVRGHWTWTAGTAYRGGRRGYRRYSESTWGYAPEGPSLLENVAVNGGKNDVSTMNGTVNGPVNGTIGGTEDRNSSRVIRRSMSEYWGSLEQRRRGRRSSVGVPGQEASQKLPSPVKGSSDEEVQNGVQRAGRGFPPRSTSSSGTLLQGNEGLSGVNEGEKERVGGRRRPPVHPFSDAPEASPSSSDGGDLGETGNVDGGTIGGIGGGGGATSPPYSLRRRVGGSINAMRSSVQLQQPAVQMQSLEGRALDRPPVPTKIVSLLPSVTETLVELGVGDRLAGISDMCDVPDEIVTKLHVVSRTAPEHTVSCSNLEDAIKCFRALPERNVELDVNWLQRTQPDLVFTKEKYSPSVEPQDNVGVALKEADLLESSNTSFCDSDPQTMSQVLETMVSVGEAVGLAARAHSIVERLRIRLRHVAKSVSGEGRPKVLCLSSVWPPVLGGLWIPEMISLGGGIDGLQEPGCPPEPVVWENVTSYSPDVIFLLADSDNIQRTRLELKYLASLPGFWSFPAVLNGRFFILDNNYFNVPGPRLVEGVEIFARLLHPTRVRFRIESGLVTRLILDPVQRCRPEDLHKYFQPYQ